MRDLKRLLKDGTISQTEFTAATKKTREEFRRTEKSSKTTFGAKGTELLATYARGLIGGGGVLAALKLVKGEYNNIIQRAQEAAQLAQTPASAQETFLANLAADTVQERDAAIARAKKISRRHGVPIETVYHRGSEAVSARGDKSVDYAMNAVDASYSYAPGNAEAGRAGASAALDIGRATGFTPRQSLGFLQLAGKQARITSPGKLARNVAPMLGALVDAGATPQEAGGLFSALSQRMVDAKGEQVRTASINFSKKLRDYANKAVLAGAVKAAAVDTFGERLKYVQATPDRQADFLENTTFEALASMPLEKLVRGGNTFQLYKKFRDELPTAEQAGAGFRRRVAIREGAPLQKTEALRRTAAATVEAMALRDPQRARAGVLYDEYESILRQSGQSAAITKLERFGNYAHGGNLQFMREGLLKRQRELEAGVTYRKDWSSPRQTHIPPSPADLENAAAIGRLIDKLDGLNADVREAVTTGIRDGMDELQRQNVPNPAVSHGDHN